MRRVIILTYSAFLIIMLANFFYYNNLYKTQIKYISELLDRQVQIVGIEVDNTNNEFDHDLQKLNYDYVQDLPRFFENPSPDLKLRVTEALKLFYSKYKDFVFNMRVY